MGEIVPGVTITTLFPLLPDEEAPEDESSEINLPPPSSLRLSVKIAAGELAGDAW